MTDDQIDDCFTGIGRAFVEKRALLPRLAELKKKLNAYGKALDAATRDDELDFSPPAAILDNYKGDPVTDWAAFKTGLSRLEKLNKILSG